MHETVVVSDWNELNAELYRDSWNANLERFRSNFLFRGMQDSRLTLRTGLMRLGPHGPGVERHVLRNFIKYAHFDAHPGDTQWHWLALAQHHGLPTRLLDWTYSPFVALHFVTTNIDRYNVDGVVWCVNYVESNRFLPDSFRTYLANIGSHVFTAEMLNEVAGTLEYFDSLAPPDYAVFFEPPSLDARIVNQFALFSMLSNPGAPFETWIDEHPTLVRKIIIPADLKWEIRDKLDQANINERVLFPGLDGLSLWLRRHYSAKPHFE